MVLFRPAATPHLSTGPDRCCSGNLPRSPRARPIDGGTCLAGAVPFVSPHCLCLSPSFSLTRSPSWLFFTHSLLSRARSYALSGPCLSSHSQSRLFPSLSSWPLRFVFVSLWREDATLGGHRNLLSFFLIFALAFLHYLPPLLLLAPSWLGLGAVPVIIVFFSYFRAFFFFSAPFRAPGSYAVVRACRYRQMSRPSRQPPPASNHYRADAISALVPSPAAS